jgi:hypothetical protein
MKNRRLILWNSREDCIVWHRTQEHSSPEWREFYIKQSMLNGNKLPEDVALDLAESYDVRVV